jgi:intein-encoded DNA endonuclease-like protein
MSIEEKAYIAGFLDGDGCIMAQLVRHKDYVYGYQVRVSIVFYQKRTREEILSWLKSKLNYGYVRFRNDGMAEYTIVGLKEVREILELLYPFLRLKKVLAKQVISLINTYPKKISPKELIRLSVLVDQTATFNYSKKRTNNAETVKTFLKTNNFFPVETSVKKENLLG